MDISKRFSLGGLLRYTFPTVIMLLFSSIYAMVDGIFVSKYVGSDALSSINIVYPLMSVSVGIGVMFGTGGSAIVAKTLGEGDSHRAKAYFTTITIATTVTGALFGGLCLLFIEPLSRFLGASDRLLPYCVDYGTIILLSSVFSVLQLLFQMFFVTAGKPHIGLGLTIASGVANIVLDYVFIVPFNMGVKGAALATSISYLVGSVIPVLYFIKNKSSLSFVKPEWNVSILIESIFNGSSEMVSNLAASITTFLFNISMIRLAGEDGVAAITILLYSQFLFTSMFIGFSNGVAPIISYNYGSSNKKELKRLFKMSTAIVLVGSVVISLLSQLIAPVAISVFAQKGSSVYNMAISGYRLFALNFLIAGTNIFISSFFTALSNGKASAAVSFARTFLFQAGGILVLPLFLDITGIWFAVPIAEICTIVFAVWLLNRFKYVYGYI